MLEFISTDVFSALAAKLPLNLRPHHLLQQSQKRKGIEEGSAYSIGLDFDVGTLPVPELTSNENAGIENPGSREDTRL